MTPPLPTPRRSAVMTTPDPPARVNVLPQRDTRAADDRRARPRMTPQALARLHDRYLSALWRGDDVAVVADWLAAHWQAPAPPAPCGEPDAVSCMGGVGLHWYRRGAAIYGYPSGTRPGCYRISIWEAAPVVPGLLHGGYAFGSAR